MCVLRKLLQKLFIHNGVNLRKILNNICLYFKFFTFTPANIPSLVSATKVKLIVVQEIPDPELEVLYGVNASDDGLSVIDPTTGVVTFLGSLDPDPNLLVTPVAMAVT